MIALGGLADRKFNDPNAALSHDARCVLRQRARWGRGTCGRRGARERDRPSARALTAARARRAARLVRRVKLMTLMQGGDETEEAFMAARQLDAANEKRPSLKGKQ